jgi:hypothetical protein
METPRAPQISVSGRILIEGQLPAPSGATSENAPVHPPPSWWKFWRRSWWEDHQRLTAYATLLLAFGTIVLATFSLIQICDFRDQERRQLRAYVIAKSARFARDEAGKLKFGLVSAAGAKELLIYYDVSNEGITPAYDVFRLVDVEYPFNKTFNFNYTDGTAAYLSKQQIFGPIRTRGFTQEQIDMIMSGKGPPFVFAGKITYRDIFGDTWPTNFCFMYTGLPVEPNFTFCPRWSPSDTLNYAR